MHASGELTQAPVSAPSTEPVDLAIDPFLMVAQTPEAKPQAGNLVVLTVPAPADRLFRAVREVMQMMLKVPMRDTEVSTALDVSNAQAKAWLLRLLDEGVIEKRKKPAGYIVKQSSLFE